MSLLLESCVFGLSRIGRRGIELQKRRMDRPSVAMTMNLNEDPRPAPASCEAREVLTLREAAELLRINVRSLQRLMKAGAVPYAMLGRSVRFRKTKLLAWLDRGGARRLDSIVAPRGRGRAQAPGRGREGDVLAALEEPVSEATLDTRGARA
jgi:excisionase family DNA binding protein